MDQQARTAELQQLRRRVEELEQELAVDAPTAWVPRTYYTAYHILAGMILGLVSAAASLLFNVIGAVLVGKDPLQLIRVYLTFPLGEKALTEPQPGFILAAGCGLYLMTGMFGGIPFHLILSRFFDRATFGVRFAVATVLGLGVWIINFYGLIAWLQPALIGGNWILEQIPVYVAAGTHLVFGWSMLLVDQWGRFNPGQRPVMAEGRR